MLLEADEVEVQVLHAVFLKQVLSNETVQVDSCLRQSIILIQSRFTLDRTEVASIIAHVQRLLLVSSKSVSDCMWDDTS